MSKTRLSVNINKFATLRNARGGNNPDLVKAALDAERFGAQGITVHPRPDERHIRYNDVFDLAKVVTTEFNIEGNPKGGRYMEVVRAVKPAQATLVPDSTDVLTSNAGWDTVQNASYLKEVIAELKSLGIRTSIFIDPIPEMIEAAADTGTDRIELYTESFADIFKSGKPEEAIGPYQKAAELAHSLGIELNAGHDLDLDNLAFFARNIPHLKEVSIGHALVCDALYFGFENAVGMYLRELQ